MLERLYVLTRAIVGVIRAWAMEGGAQVSAQTLELELTELVRGYVGISAKEVRDHLDRAQLKNDELGDDRSSVERLQDLEEQFSKVSQLADRCLVRTSRGGLICDVV